MMLSFGKLQIFDTTDIVILQKGPIDFSKYALRLLITG